MEPVNTIVTGSDRLARQLHERVANAERAAGRRAWQQPDILPVGAFWRRLAGELRHDPALALAQRRVLSRNAMLCRWEAFVIETLADQPLLQSSGAARVALDAWQLCRDWQLNVDALAGDPLEETRWLVEWGRRFEQECIANARIPEYALPEAVLAALEQSQDARAVLPSRIQLAGFMERSPLDEQRWASLRALGVTVEDLPPPRLESSVRCLPCDDPRTETRAVAAWVRERLRANPALRIGIVVPDLALRRAALKRELIDALQPQRLAQFDNAPLPFNFSLGHPLAEQALVRDALAVLALASRRVEFATAARLCRSPFFTPEPNPSARYALEAAMRREGYAECSLRDWQFLAARENCSVLAEMLAAYRAAINDDADEVLPSAWAQRFGRWLEIFGWCHGRALDSAEYQAREAWQGVLGQLVELDAVLGKCQRATALAWLNRFAQDTAFQPRAADAPVQVLGLLEATGMQFDALWVMGMTDSVLPASPRPNPFLPVTVQRAKHLPQSSAARELRFAQDLFAGLRNASPEVICSYPVRDNDAELGPSPLLKGMQFAQAPAPFMPVADNTFGRAVLEQVMDSCGPRHPGGTVRGGTALLQNQSHCPFRAFAIHRLQAGDWPTPLPGPDAMVRGLLAHRVLEKLWMEWRTRSRLQALNDSGELAGVVHATVAGVVEDAVKKMPYRWSQGLRDIECRRLANIVLRWMNNVELPRPDFAVTEVEGRRADGSGVATMVQAGPIVLRGKLDRVDRLHDGSELIIDYKSGGAPSKNHFFGERPRAPQLPAYVLARKQSGNPVPRGIAVGSLRAGGESLQGVMDTGDDAQQDGGIAGLVSVAKARQAGDWNEAVEHWEHAIHALGESFARGDAAVDPLQGACDYCHLATLCRIHEQVREHQSDGEMEGDD